MLSTKEDSEKCQIKRKILVIVVWINLSLQFQEIIQRRGKLERTKYSTALLNK